ncbi:PAS domain-containing protein [Thalassobaculum sp.]|uniref:PAS domain-containing protein n=1 Tax=Thalassobaculum sp. TaxID=2022740 RepID=UPI003B5C763D
MTLPNSSSDRIGRLFRYWTELRTDGAVPGIATFDPLHVADLMPNLWMAGWKEEVGDFVYRVAGDAILTTVDRPMHHRSLREIYPAALADRLRERFTRVCGTPCLYHAKGTIYLRIGRYGAGERLILPFRDRDGSTPVVLGCTDYQFVAQSGRIGAGADEDLVEIVNFLTLDGEPMLQDRAVLSPTSV